MNAAETVIHRCDELTVGRFDADGWFDADGRFDEGGRCRRHIPGLRGSRGG